jgi:hypothetical protein
MAEIREKRCAAPDRHRMNVEPIFVHQTKPDQGLDEPYASVRKDFGAWPGLKRGRSPLPCPRGRSVPQASGLISEAWRTLLWECHS